MNAVRLQGDNIIVDNNNILLIQGAQNEENKRLDLILPLAHGVASYLTSLCSPILLLCVWLKRWLGKKFPLFLNLWMLNVHIYLSLFT